MENKIPEVQIKVTEESFKGTYANGAIISHTQTEFLLDFIAIFHQKGILGSRVIVSPNQAKRILRALNENISMFEKKFGEIKEAEDLKFNINEAH